MKFRSILSFSPKLRTNAILCLIFAIISSLQTLIASVRIQPQDKAKAIWNTQQLFVTCIRDQNENGGTLKWFKPNGNEVDDNNKASVYQTDSHNSVKLFFINTTKKSSGTYECRHYRDNKLISSDRFELTVYNSINMEGNKDSYVGIEGNSFTMVCFARFDPDQTEAQVSWSHNNLQIKEREGQFTVSNRVEQSVTQKIIKSTLSIRNLSKENEGLYVCQSVYANPSLTDMKNIDINLRVQFKPRFPENTQKYVWISEETQSPVVVNVTCLVNADPVAKFQWFNGHNQVIDKGQHKAPKHTIHSTENLSVLSLEYRNTDEIKNNFKSPDGINRKFQCRAWNEIGDARIIFELNVGRLPETPILANYSYENGVLLLTVNDTKVDPPIDSYRLEISENTLTIYFNASQRIEMSNNTYEIRADVPTGEHTMKIYAHNPVGWSIPTDPNPPMFLIISNACVAQQYIAYVLIGSMVASTLGLVNTF